MDSTLVLASGSAHRRLLLENAAVPIRVDPSRLDERALEAPLRGEDVDGEEIALVLAEAKAADVAARHPGALVIGADQTLSLGARLFHKPADMEAARRSLLALQGETHTLASAAAIVRDGETLWRHVGTARITLRALDPPAVGRYLAAVGDAALGSVGSYQVEGRGIRIIERIEGDFFTVIGLPLLPLLAELRRLGAIHD